MGGAGEGSTVSTAGICVVILIGISGLDVAEVHVSGLNVSKFFVMPG